MLIEGIHYQTIWPDPKGGSFFYTFDQNKLPFRSEICRISSWKETATAIRDMTVRGAPLIGVTGAFGIWLICCEAHSHQRSKDWIIESAEKIRNARPTAVNLGWAVDRIMKMILAAGNDSSELKAHALAEAMKIASEDVNACRAIGKFGQEMIVEIYKQIQRPINILTHCNAGWLATVDWGTATAPIYAAHQNGIPLHVWVDETRPRNQGLLTAWELQQNGIDNTLITDNTGGLLMMQGKVDIVITGADRVTRNGDAANKTGTYLKALAAADNQIPFYVAIPSSTFDMSIRNGIDEIRIEERNDTEIRMVKGIKNGVIQTLQMVPDGVSIHNPAFDITPARLITGFITERGITQANEIDICRLFPEFEIGHKLK